MTDKEYEIYKQETKRGTLAVFLGALAASILILSVFHCVKPIRDIIYNNDDDSYSDSDTQDDELKLTKE